ncbi:MAG: periplasmic heavy metal sensor [Prolixibacteraceae bacterium]|nr:periplasmic heavy metal sensor [Prolixibacteraceae bacterium]
MKKRTLAWIVILVTIANISSLATMFYLKRQNSVNCQPHSRFEQVEKEVGLTPSQNAQFQVYRETFHKDLDSLEQLLYNQRRKLSLEIRKEKPDSIHIHEITEHIVALQKKSQNRAINHFFQIKKILTLEQQETFFNLALENCFLTQQRIRIYQQKQSNRQ